MRTDINKKSGLWEGIEVEHTRFKGLPTLFVCRASALYRVPSYPHLPHVYIDVDDPNFWNGTEIGFAALESHVRSLLQNHKRKVTLGCSDQRTDVVSWTSDVRRLYPLSFCLLISLRLMCPDLAGWAVKIVPYKTFSDEWKESGVLVRTADEFEKGRTVWSEYQGDKDLP